MSILNLNGWWFGSCQSVVAQILPIDLFHLYLFLCFITFYFVFHSWKKWWKIMIMTITYKQISQQTYVICNKSKGWIKGWMKRKKMLYRKWGINFPNHKISNIKRNCIWFGILCILFYCIFLFIFNKQQGLWDVVSRDEIYLESKASVL